MLKCNSIYLFVTLIAVVANVVNAAQEEQTTTVNNSNNTSNKLFAYAGSFLPSDWTLVSILNDRAVIGFNNGSARNALISELDSRDRTFLQRLQNGTIYTTPLSSAKEKLAQWSSSVSSTVTKFGKSVKDQLDSFINSKPKESGMNTTTIILN